MTQSNWRLHPPHQSLHDGVECCFWPRTKLGKEKQKAAQHAHMQLRCAEVSRDFPWLKTLFFVCHQALTSPLANFYQCSHHMAFFASMWFPFSRQRPCHTQSVLGQSFQSLNCWKQAPTKFIILFSNTGGHWPDLWGDMPFGDTPKSANLSALALSLPRKTFR